MGVPFAAVQLPCWLPLGLDSLIALFITPLCSRIHQRASYASYLKSHWIMDGERKKEMAPWRRRNIDQGAQDIKEQRAFQKSIVVNLTKHLPRDAEEARRRKETEPEMVAFPQMYLSDDDETQIRHKRLQNLGCLPSSDNGDYPRIMQLRMDWEGRYWLQSIFIIT